MSGNNPDHSKEQKGESSEPGKKVGQKARLRGFDLSFESLFQDPPLPLEEEILLWPKLDKATKQNERKKP